MIEKLISGRFLSQDDRIEIADGLAAGERVKEIAARIGKSYQSLYRGIARNRKPDGRYQPWYAHGQAHLKGSRPKTKRFAPDIQLRDQVAGRLATKWSSAQVSGGCAAASPPGAHGMYAPRPSIKRSELAWSSRRWTRARAAHQEDLPASSGSWPYSGRSLEAVHCDEVDTRSSPCDRGPRPGRALGISVVLSSRFGEGWWLLGEESVVAE